MPELVDTLMSSDRKRRHSFVAHVRKSDQAEQSLLSHLVQVSDITSKFSSKVSLGNAGAIMGLLHDLGKYRSKFQEYLKSATGLKNPDEDGYVDAKELKGKIDHSSAGALHVWQFFHDKYSVFGPLYGQILALCIASHHSGLIDCLDPCGQNTFKKRIGKAEDRGYLDGLMDSVEDELRRKAEALFSKASIVEFRSFLKPLIDNEAIQGVDTFSNGVLQFKLGMLTRFLFSCLIDADRIDSADFENPKLESGRDRFQRNWRLLVARLEERITSFQSRNDVDRLRTQVSQTCLLRSKEQKGLFSLTVPTGGGKTFASLRFALNHALHHQMDRVIYVVPFTAIIDQNAAEVRKVLEKPGDSFPFVLEHHSNLEPEKQTWQSKLAADNWDSPVVFTTMVQFLETLFGGGTRGPRRMHTLANSVIIFDEIQSLPIKTVHLFCNAINFLTDYCGATVVMCTATQPLLDKLKYREKGFLPLEPENELMQNLGLEKLFEKLERVTVINRTKAGGWSLEELAQFAGDELKRSGSCLVIVNTKVWAIDLYNASQPQFSEGVYHLSTNMCPVHRLEILAEIRQRLVRGQPVLCFSTQLIEAGVDIDFGTVIRFTAGLDAIAQAAGRCNRHGNRVNGMVYIVNPDLEKISSHPDIKLGQDALGRVLKEYKDNSVEFENSLLSPSSIKRYFMYYFYEQANQMDYPVDAEKHGQNDTLLNLLSANPNNSGKDARIPQLSQSFREAARLFKAIESPTEGILVKYGAGQDLINQFLSCYDPVTRKQLFRHVQRYSVGLYPYMFTQLQEKDALTQIPDTELYYLDERYYSQAFGVALEPVSMFNPLIC